MPFVTGKAKREISGQSAIDQIGVHAGITRTRIFDYERRKNPETVNVHIPFVESVKSTRFIDRFNPQPIHLNLEDVVHSQRKSAFFPVLNKVTGEQAMAAEKVKSTIALTKIRPHVLGRVALHSPSFGLAQKAKELPMSTRPTLLDKLFDAINSIGKKK